MRLRNILSKYLFYSVPREIEIFDDNNNKIKC